VGNDILRSHSRVGSCSCSCCIGNDDDDDDDDDEGAGDALKLNSPPVYRDWICIAAIATHCCDSPLTRLCIDGSNVTVLDSIVLLDDEQEGGGFDDNNLIPSSLRSQSEGRKLNPNDLMTSAFILSATNPSKS